jgi:hypothetical protein
MSVEEIAKKVSEKTYLKLCKARGSETNSEYSFEQYWERNKEYFTQHAKIYLEVKECMEE